jgi:hypothetical protein
MASSIVTFAAVLLSGCSRPIYQPDIAPSTGKAAEDAHSHASHEGHSHDDAGATNQSSKNSKIEDAFAKLSQEDRDAAIRQKICPVSDEPLGSMGPPIKVPVQGRDVYICCAGCADFLKEEPDKYLAKLAKPEAK